MSRKREGPDGSLELLLDTICNTFGGVLFISILVVILLNMSSKQAETTPPTDAARAELIEAQARLSKTNDELEQLLTAIQTQEQISGQIVGVCVCLFFVVVVIVFLFCSFCLATF